MVMLTVEHEQAAPHDRIMQTDMVRLGLVLCCGGGFL